MRLLWLARVARDAGLTVVETAGWEKRGRDMEPPRVVIAHHTATPARAAGDYPSLRVVTGGRHDLPGPLCHLGLGRRGVVYVVASGKANHAGAGTWRGCSRSVETIGIEAEHPGDSTPWPAAQVDAFDRLTAAILNHLRLDYRALCAHREWARPLGRKIDPTGIDMDAMRRRVAVLLEQHKTREDWMAHLTEAEQRELLELARTLGPRPDLMGDPAAVRDAHDHARFAHLDALTALTEVRALRDEVRALLERGRS